MGFQHGTFLKEKIQKNIQKYIKTPSSPSNENEKNRMKEFLDHLPIIQSFIPSNYIEEMKGIAEGSNSSFEDILLLNLFPEMFHCCGITASGEATKNSSLYHVRVLDYSAGKDLQESAVLILAKPKDALSFLNVTYAGFIGSVTGMNEEKISIGEIGGQGYGNWNGMPMSFLLRSVLEKSKTLNEAQEILATSPRTCEYYYIVSDGKTDDSFSCYATDSQIKFLKAGENYSISPSTSEDLCIEKGISDHPLALFCKQPKDTLLLTGFSSPERYPVLLNRIEELYGNLDEKSLIEVIKSPVSKEANLHNVIFHPKSLTLWVSHAGPNGEPAASQEYVKFNFEELKKIFF